MNLNSTLKNLKEMIKKLKIEDSGKQKAQDTKEEDLHLADEELILSKNKKAVLDNVNMKPTLAGKKTIGSLETHINGFRFVSTKGQKLDITFKNIKHAFF